MFILIHWNTHIPNTFLFMNVTANEHFAHFSWSEVTVGVKITHGKINLKSNAPLMRIIMDSKGISVPQPNAFQMVNSAWNPNNWTIIST